MKKLTKLPWDTWIDLNLISCIKIKELSPGRFVLYLLNSERDNIDYVDFLKKETAKKWAEEIAGLIEGNKDPYRS